MILSNIWAVWPAASLRPRLNFSFSSSRDWFFSTKRKSKMLEKYLIDNTYANTRQKYIPQTF
jgi:hypothetical protein